MYKLTPRMLQHFERDLEKYHQLFDGGRCSGWEQEELLVKAIKADTGAQHHVLWREAGHDDKADITVQPGEHLIQIKSGQETKDCINISGHRLGRFADNFDEITNYLNAIEANIMSVRYRQENDDAGRKHIYQLCYLDVRKLKGITVDGWEKNKSYFGQTNGYNVDFSLRPSLSWQIWWKVPKILFEETPEIIIG